MKASLTILVVEDSKPNQILIEHALSGYYNLAIVDNGKKALEIVKNQTIDLILLDIMLPDTNGYDLCRELKASKSTASIPIIFLTSKETIEDKVKGFELGAEDYITKPFNPIELKIRIQSKLRNLDKNENTIYEDDEITVNFQSKRVIIKNSNSEILLTQHEYNIFEYFLKHADHVLSRDQIIQSVWKDNTHITSRTIDTHISKLRKKLGTYGEQITTCHGSGYRYTPLSKKSA